MEAFAVHVAHDEEDDIAMFLDGVDGDDIRLREQAGRSGLAQEVVANGLIGRYVGIQELDRYWPVGGYVPRQIDHGPSTTSNFPFQREPASDYGLERDELWREPHGLT